MSQCTANKLSVMIIPIRCYSCNNTLANKWDIYQDLLAKGHNQKTALTKVGLHRQCCRTTLKQHVNVIDHVLKFDYYDHKIPVQNN